MTDLDLLVDDYGKVWRTGSPALLRNLRIEEREYDLTSYLIRNLGFARFRIRRTDSRIMVQPRFLTKATCESLVHVMVQNDPRRFAIEAIDMAMPIEIVPDLEDAVARLGDPGDIGRQCPTERFLPGAIIAGPPAPRRAPETSILDFGPVARFRWRDAVGYGEDSQ
jgi:hypothetical protein